MKTQVKNYKQRRLKIGCVSMWLIGWLFLSFSSVFAIQFPNDSYVHYSKDGSTCNEHMDNFQVIPQPNLVLCKRNSGATTWFAMVYLFGAYNPVCVFGSSQFPQIVPVSGIQSFSCPITVKGNYKAYVYWRVGGSQLMSSFDQWFKK
jgi:hypothetical protein